MRLTYPYQTDHLGAVRVYGLQQVFELESGASNRNEATTLSWGTTVCQVPAAALQSIHRRMAVVVPARNERLRLVEGVLAGIPHECLLVFVSKSDRHPVDRFAMEREAVERFCRFNQRAGILVHQSDPRVGDAFTAAGMPELVDPGAGLRSGKGEALILGVALAHLAGKEFVGFVDADNYVPGSVTEYVNAFAANFALTERPHAMVRIHWPSKPKVVDGSLFFPKFGRVSETTNRFLNLYLSHLTGFGTEAIRTGNAGEHAMSIDLALKLRLSGGFGVEPGEVVELLERFGGLGPGPPAADVAMMRDGIDLYQVETLNPHFHDDKGVDHVAGMRRVALATIRGSHLCPGWLREEIEHELRREGIEDSAAELVTASPYPPLSGLDWNVLEEQLGSGDGPDQFGIGGGDQNLLAGRPRR